MTETISLTINNNTHAVQVPEGTSAIVLDAFKDAYNYSETIENPDYSPEDENSERTIPNPVTPERYFGTCIRNYVQDIVRAYQLKLARKQAEEAASSQVNSIFSQITVE